MAPKRSSDGLVWQSEPAEEWVNTRLRDVVVELGSRQVKDEGPPVANRTIWRIEAMRVYRAGAPDEVLQWEWNGGAERTIVPGVVTAGLWKRLSPLLPLLHPKNRGGHPGGGEIRNDDQVYWPLPKSGIG